MSLTLTLLEDNFNQPVEEQYMIVGVKEKYRAYAQYKISFNEHGMSTIEIVSDKELPVNEMTLAARVLKTIDKYYTEYHELYTDIFTNNKLEPIELPLAA